MESAVMALLWIERLKKKTFYQNKKDQLWKDFFNDKINQKEMEAFHIS